MKHLFISSYQPPQNEEEWRNLLQKQEQLHSAEIERWLRILRAAEHLLKQVNYIFYFFNII
jgi:cation transport regulator ChaC